MAKQAKQGRIRREHVAAGQVLSREKLVEAMSAAPLPHHPDAEWYLDRVKEMPELVSPDLLATEPQEASSRRAVSLDLRPSYLDLLVRMARQPGVPVSRRLLAEEFGITPEEVAARILKLERTLGAPLMIQLLPDRHYALQEYTPEKTPPEVG